MFDDIWERNLMKHTQRYIYILEANGIIINASCKAKEYHKDFKDKIEGMSIFDVVNFNEFYFKDGTKLIPKYNPVYNMVENPTPEVMSMTIMKNDNDKILSYEFECYPILDDNNKMAGITVIFRDITEWVNILAEENRKNEKFRDLYTELQGKCSVLNAICAAEKQNVATVYDILRNISEGIIVMKSINEVEFANDALYRILGIMKWDIEHESSNLSRYIVFKSDNTNCRIRELLKSYLDSGKVDRDIVEYIAPVFEKRKYIEFNGKNVYDDHGVYKYMIITVKDITDKKEHEGQLEHTRLLGKHILNAIDVPVAMFCYPSLKVDFINCEFKKSMSSIFKDGICPEPMDYFPDMLEEKLQSKLNGFIEKGILHEEEYVINDFKVTSEEKEKIYKIKLTPYKDNDGNIKSVFVYGIDVTEEVESNNHLKNINKMKDDYFANTSHEIRTQLNLISSSVQLAQNVYKNEITPNINNTFTIINNNCPKLLKLINNILDMSKAEAGFLTLNESNFDIVETTKSIVELSLPYASEKKLTLKFYCCLNEYYVYMDKNKYERIILNLLSNAVKYTPASGNVQVFLSIEGSYLIIRVSDEGIGIPEDKLPFIFDRFMRVENADNKEVQGTGIGLSLVKKLTEIMNGNIYVDSIEGEGTSFTLEFLLRNIKIRNIKNTDRCIENLKRKAEIEFSDVKA